MESGAGAGPCPTCCRPPRARPPWRLRERSTSSSGPALRRREPRVAGSGCGPTSHRHRRPHGRGGLPRGARRRPSPSGPPPPRPPGAERGDDRRPGDGGRGAGGARTRRWGGRRRHLPGAGQARLLHLGLRARGGGRLEAQRLVLAGDRSWKVLDLFALQALLAHRTGSWFDRMRVELVRTRENPEMANALFDGYLCAAEYMLYGQTPYDRGHRRGARPSGDRRAGWRARRPHWRPR